MRIVFAAITLIALSALSATAQDAARAISVTGQGMVQAQPDMATITLGVTHQARTAQAAMDATSDATAAVLEVLAKAGIAPRDMQTSDLGLDPQWDHRNSADGRAPGVIGFVARNTVTVRVRDLDGLGPVLDAVLGAGANTFRGLQFGLQDPQPVLDAAREAAVADALRKARLIADAAGVTLGPIQSITEAGGQVPGPVVMMEAARAAMPVAQGEVGMSAQVSVVVAIAD